VRDFVGFVLLLFGVVVFVLLLILMAKDYQVFHECKDYGFDDGTGKLFNDSFCTKVRQSDGVVIQRSLDWVKSHCNELGECQE